ALFVAYAGSVPAAAGRLQTPAGRVFASIWGGGTVPDYRRRGIYRAMVGERAREARRRGYRYITVDARATSRPILERLGFVALDGVTGWVLRPRE
ncbi:MAG: GNAT family N-acetyltransferase, partial [Candidatus Elarobacter sp.]